MAPRIAHHAVLEEAAPGRIVDDAVAKRSGSLGMESAISEKLHTYTKSLWRYAMALTRDPASADDLVQECLKRALTYIKDDQKIRDVRAYLFTILHNVHMDELARNQRSGIHVPIDEDGTCLAYPAPQNTYVTCRELPKALDRLPREQRSVLLLVGLEGLSYRDAAEVLDVPVGTVMSRLSRGREALRAIMAPEPDNDEAQPARAKARTTRVSRQRDAVRAG